jgi:hypothetical protein
VIEKHRGKIARVKKTKLERVPVLPHVVNQPRWRARFGAGAIVSGWLGSADGSALAGQTIRLLTAPDNGQHQFTQGATATTDQNGGWTAQLPAGPSRIVQAVYDGGPTVEPSVSAPINVIVPAKIDVRFSPTWIAWTAGTTITGRLVGGYILPDGVALRLLTGSRRSPIVLHALRTDSRGTFRFSWGFGAGSGIARYPLRISTLSTETECPSGVTRTEVSDMFSRNKKRREIERALGVLEDAGRLRRETRQPDRGRSAEVWIPVLAEAA